MASRGSSFRPSVPKITGGKTAMGIWWNANIVASWDTKSMSALRSMDIQLKNIMANKAPDREISKIIRTGIITVVGIRIIRGIGMETSLLKVASSLEDLLRTAPEMAMKEPVRL